MPLEPLCPDPATWRITALAPERDRSVLHLEPMRRTVTCPVCGHGSRRVHSRYRRKPWDVPWGRWPVQLVVSARRFFCDAPDCPRRIFTEPFPGVLARYARQIAREVGLDRRTVRKYLAVDQPPVYPPRRPRPTQLTPYWGYLAKRWAEGCHNARRLYQELVPRGYRGSEGMVRVIVRPWRLSQATNPHARTPAQLTWLLLQPAGRLTEADRQAVEDYLHANPLLAQGYQLKTRFHTLLAGRDPAALDQWLQEAVTWQSPSAPGSLAAWR